MSKSCPVNQPSSPLTTVSYNSQQVLNTLIQEVSDVIWVKDLEGRYLLINDAGAGFFGKRVEDIIGKNDAELFTPETGQKIRATDLKVIQTGETLTIEDLLVTKNGKQRIFSAVKAVYRDEDGNIQGVLGIIRDITERRELEESLKLAKEVAEEANRKKSQFLANMSHELRTPLHTVITGSNIALEGMLGPLEPQVTEYFSLIQHSGKHLLQVIDEILDFSKIEAGKFELMIQEINIREYLRQTMALIYPLAHEKGQPLQVIQAPDAPETFQGDFIRLKQALCNLLSNAQKFSPPQTPIIIRYFCEDSRYLCFSVQDYGPGIPEAEQGLILEPFEQGQPSVYTSIGGTGLGLPLVKKIAELHQGSLEIYSKVGMGSIFTLKIPFQPQDPPLASSVPPAKKVAGKRAKQSV